MKYIIFFLAALFIISCDNELDLVADYKETPVVYGLINQADTAQYIRVERAFIDKSISGTVLAQNPDSLYYDDITVKLVRLANDTEYILERVDGNEEGYVRDEGTFAQAPNYLYKIMTEDIVLEEEENIELRIEGIFEDRDVTATADVLIAPFFVSPSDEGNISFINNRISNIGWNPKGDPTIYSASFFFNVQETKAGVVTDKQIEWVIEANTDKTIIEINGIEFYSFMVGALDKDPDITRVLGKAEFELIAGNQTVSDYIKVGQANLGITSSGEIPTFTNLSEGLGLFGSKVSDRRVKLNVSSATRDSLINSSITAELNFQ